MHTVMKKFVGAAGFAIAAAASTCADAQAAESLSFNMGDNAPASISPAAIARAQAKMERAQQLVERLAPTAASEGFENDAWRTELMSAVLMRNSDAAFAAAELADGIHAALDAVRAVPAASASGASAKSLGSTTDDLVFHPLPSPCRIVDTRVASAGGPIAAAGSRTFDFNGGETSQGGSSCLAANIYNIPVAAINVTVVAPVGTAGASGFLRIYPPGTTTTTSYMNYVVGGIIANAGIIELKVNSGNVYSQFAVYSQYKTNIVVDAFGSFESPAATPLACTTTSASLSVPVSTATSSTFIAYPSCTTGFTRTGGYCSGAGTVAGYLIESGPGGCAYRNQGTAAFNGNAVSQCCQIPGR